MKRKTFPLFCNKCGALALAEIEGEMLCAACLFEDFEKIELSNQENKLKPLYSIEERDSLIFENTSENTETMPVQNIIIS